MYNDNNNKPKFADSDYNLLTLYNVIDWIDFILIFVIIVYIGASQSAIVITDFADVDARYIWNSIVENLTVVSLVLCLASLAVSCAAIVTALQIYKKGLNRNPFRLLLRFIAWGVWIPVDLAFIVLAIRNII